MGNESMPRPAISAEKERNTTAVEIPLGSKRDSREIKELIRALRRIAKNERRRISWISTIARRSPYVIMMPTPTATGCAKSGCFQGAPKEDLGRLDRS